MRFLAATTRMAMLQATKIAVHGEHGSDCAVHRDVRLTEDDVTIDCECFAHGAVKRIVRKGRGPLNG